ncbi:MAG: NADH-quinone oxidoreductase subunit NuoH [Candidatus Hatepunaea meridiana]|nr:NADH-quinone oxidoreductase subunit NuoH [Candidatus Hatepunaea meridiana]
MDMVIFIASLVKMSIAVSVVMGLATLLTWVERKQSAVMQDRLGANRADIFGIRIIGLFQPIADAIKMITKEDFVPPFANKWLHTLAPVISFAPVLMVFAVIPFGPPIEVAGHTITMQIADINIGLLYVFAFGGLAIYGAVIAGWSSNNKYTLIAAVRASAQMISYEVCLGLSLIGAIMIYGTLDMTTMIQQQSGYWFGWIPRWGLLMQPLGALLFLPAAIAENKRVPFDLPECESEILGYFTEYSGLRSGMFMFAEFIEIVFVSALFSVIFLGGWQVPYLTWEGFSFPWGGTIYLNIWLVKALEFGSLFFKIAVMIYFCILVRWTLPRFRYDQLMKLGWKYLLPLAIVNLLITGIVLVVLG